MSIRTMASDDIFPEEYPYAWSPTGSSINIQEFVSKYKPSMVQNDGTRPWIWVRKELSPSDRVAEEHGATKEASELLQRVTERVEEIKNDSSIPVRSSKKTGAKSKKELREQEQANATVRLKEISQKHGYVCGKWLIFAPSDRVDAIWASVARSLSSGPLASTVASAAKVATSPEHETPGYQHVICIYVPDVYDRDNVVEVMKVLLRQHGVNLSGVKSDLYTSIGLDSKHPSGVPSTVWKNTALLPDSEIRELKEAYFAEVTSTKNVDKRTDQKRESAPRKPGHRKRKAETDDPFASDDGESDKAEPQKQPHGSDGRNNTTEQAQENKRSQAKKSRISS
ncbi:translation initiation factor eIF 4e-like domain-containing protein [Pisolithus croceorrhizus]|nr:translation initiation factor eIF 4e-like domain-containing protein [Pisolithus croceorrhizus]